MSLSAPKVLEQSKKLKIAFQTMEKELSQRCYSAHNPSLSLTLRGTNHVMSLIVHEPNANLSLALSDVLERCLQQYHAAYTSELDTINRSFEEEHTA